MGQVRQVTEPAAWVPSPAVRTAGTPTIAWDRIVLSLVAALAVVMVCYPVAFVVLRSRFEGRHRQPLDARVAARGAQFAA